MRNKNTATRIISILAAICLIVGCSIIPGTAAETEYSVHYYKALELQEQYVSDATGAPVFGELTHESSVGAYDKLEIKIDLQAEYVNPFDPDDITVNGVFTTPSGEKMLIPGYYTIPMVSKDGKTNMVYNTNSYILDENDEAGWRVRFSGKEIGTYTFYIEVRDSKGRTAVSSVSSFNVIPSNNSGYAIVSPTNPEHFETDAENKLFYGSGANIAWVRHPFTTDPTHMSYDYFLKRAYEEGTNMTRVWICHYAWLEWMPDACNPETGAEVPSSYSYAGLGYYNQHISEAMDRILEMCEEYDIKMVLTLDDNDEHSGSGTYCNWAYNPYNVANGGPALDTTEYWSNEEAREYYKKRLRYIVARWGYSSSLFSINLWNDCSSTKNKVVYEYLQELYDYKNSITESFRPILMGSNYNHYVGTDVDENGELYDIDDIFDYTTQHLNMKRSDKPSLTQECFSSSINFKDSLHDTVWNEFMRGSGATMIWSHDNVDESGSYITLSAVQKFAQDLNLNKDKYTFYNNDGEVTANNLGLSADPYKIIEASPLGDVSAFLVKATENEFYVDYNDSSMYLAGYNSQLYGNNAQRKEYRNPPTFYINAPNGGKMMLYVGSRGSGTNVITATVNGVKQEIGRWSGQDNEPIGYRSIDLAAGQNVVKIDNTGNDWISVGKYYFIFNAADQKDVVNVSTLRSDKQTVAYVYNANYNYLYNSFLGYTPEAVSDINVRLDGFKNAAYEVKMFNPSTGRYLTTETLYGTNGKLNVKLPAKGDTDMPISLKLSGLKTEDKAISVKIDTTGMGSDMSVRGCLSYDGGYRNTGGTNKYYYLISEDGTTTQKKISGERLSIPQNFVGQLIIPMDSFRGNGKLDYTTLIGLDTLPFSLYVFGTTANTNDFVIGEINYTNSSWVKTNTALTFTDLDTMVSNKIIGTWGALKLNEDFSIVDCEINLKVPYLEHDMVFSITEMPKYKVEFIDPSGRIHDTVYVDGDTVLDESQIPELPTRTGYIITGWHSDVNSVITQDTVIRALYEKDPNYTFEVTSTNGTVQYPGSRKYATFEDLIRVSADAEKNGVPFSHWEIDGVKVSTSNPYAFRASGSVCLTAVYGESKSNPGVFLNDSAILTQVSDTKFKFSMIGQSFIPEGYTLVEAGVILAAGDKDNDSLTIADKYANGRFSIVGNAEADDFVIGNQHLSVYKPDGIASTESFGWQMEISTPDAATEAIALKLDAANVSAPFSVLPFFKNGSNTMTCTPFASAYLCYANGELVKITVGAGGNLPVPAGFVGEVIVPFNALDALANFKPESFSMYSNLIFGMTYKGLTDGDYINITDLTYRDLSDENANTNSLVQSNFMGYYKNVYQSFDGANAENLSDYANTWVHSNYMPTLGISDSGALTLTGSNTVNFFTSINGTATYDTNSKGLSFYLDMSNQPESHAIRLFIGTKMDNGASASFMSWCGAPYYYYDYNTSTLTSATISGSDQWSSWIGLPAGFKGNIFVPFESFIIPEEFADSVSQEYTYDFADTYGKEISNITLQYSSTTNAGDIIAVDDFCWLYDNGETYTESTLNSSWSQILAQDFTGINADNIANYAKVNKGSSISYTSDGRVSASREGTDELYLDIKVQSSYSITASGISFHYDATELASNGIFRVYMNANINGVRYQFMPWYGKPYYYLPDGETTPIEKKVSGSNQWNSWLNVAAGSSGTYYIPFESMMPPQSFVDSGASISAQFLHDYRELAGKNISEITIQQSKISGSTIYIDDLCWVHESPFATLKTEERFQSDFYIGSEAYKIAKVPVMAAFNNSQFMVSLTNVSKTNIRSGRAYIIVRDDKTNKLSTYYSNSVCVAEWLNQ